MVGCFILSPLRGEIFSLFFAPFPGEEISDYLAQGSLIRVLTVGVVEIGRPEMWITSDR